MGKRLLSGAIFIPLIILLLIGSAWLPILINIFIALVIGIAVGEFLHAVGLIRHLQMTIPSVLFGVSLPILIIWDCIPLVWYAYTAIMLCMLIFFHKQITFKEFAYAYSMTLIITLSMSCIVALAQNDPVHAVFYFVFVVAMPWLADAGAYFVGSFLGKHKLCPEISPKKTVEGAVGGVIVGVILTCLIALLFETCIFSDSSKVNYISLAIMSLVGSVLSVFGDLSFSLIKRSCKIKDFGNLIPGHGGILDRFDSVIFVAPFIFVAVRYFPILSV